MKRKVRIERHVRQKTDGVKVRKREITRAEKDGKKGDREESKEPQWGLTVMQTTDISSELQHSSTWETTCTRMTNCVSFRSQWNNSMDDNSLFVDLIQTCASPFTLFHWQYLRHTNATIWAELFPIFSTMKSIKEKNLKCCVFKSETNEFYNLSPCGHSVKYP